MLNAGITDGEFLFNEPPSIHFQFVNASDGIMLCQMGHDGKLPNTWSILDNQSTIDVFCNGDLLTDIREDTKSMQIHCNAGVAMTNLIGELAGWVRKRLVSSEWYCQHIVALESQGTRIPRDV